MAGPYDFDQAEPDDLPGVQPVSQPEPRPGQGLTDAAAASIPEPWGPGDDLHLTRLNNDASKVREEFGTGNIDQQAFDGLMAQINRARMPMLQRQQVAKAAALAEQQQAVLHQNAMGKSIQMQDAQADTKNFQMFTDPETGAKFFQHEPGKWKQIDVPEATTTDEATGLAEGETVEGTSIPEATGLAAGAQQDATARVVQTTPNDRGGSTLTIMNGQLRSEIERDENGRVVGTRNFDRDGQPVQVRSPVEGQALASGITGEQLDQFRAAAVRAAGQEPPPFVSDRSGRRVPNVEHQRWASAVNRIVNDQVVRQLQSNEAQRREQSRSAALAEVEHGDKWLGMMKENRKTLMDNWHRAHPGEDMPDDAHDQIQKRAEDSADRDYLNAYGKKLRSRGASGDPGDSGPTSASGRPGQNPALTAWLSSKGTLHGYAELQKSVETAMRQGTDDDKQVPENTTDPQTGIVYSPAGGSKALWKDLPPSMQKSEADRRVAERVERVTGKPVGASRPAGQSPPPSGGTFVPPDQPARTVPPAGQADAAQRDAAVANILKIHEQAWNANDPDALLATVIIRQGIERWGNIQNAPAKERAELLKAKETIDKFTNRSK